MNLAKLTATAACLAAWAIAPVKAEELKLANFMSPNHPYETAVFGDFAKRVSDATGGEVTVQVYSGGELGPGPAEQYKRAVDGVADIIFGLPGYTAANFPMTLLAELPGVITEEGGTQALLDNLSQLDNEYRRVKLLGLWTNAPNALFMREKPVRSLDDIAGLKIRVPSRNAGLIIESWGATPVSMPVPEIYNAMQTGVLDGAFIDGTATFAFKLSEVTQYITTGMNSSMSSFFLVMNRDSFGDLDADQQAAVAQAGLDISLIANKVQLGGAHKGLADFQAAEGKELITLSPEAAAAFDAASAPVVGAVVAEAEANGLAAEAFITALQASTQ